MLKIEATNETASKLTIALIGTIGSEYLPELEDLVQRATRDRRRLSFDLSQVRLVDRESLAFFISGEGHRIHFTGCPAYLREWLKSETRQRL